MALEIERKFLVHRHLLPELGRGEKMIQGYLSEKPSVRFRITGNRMIITVKEYLSGSKRFELETPERQITDQEIDKLRELAVSPPIIKVRYKYPDEQGLIWEIDVYEGENRGLITADIELPAEDYPLSFPDWVDRDGEITEDKRYSNLSLSRVPYTAWTG
jgi:CYTH domain-containing protein